MGWKNNSSGFSVDQARQYLPFASDGVYNYNPAYLVKWRAALANAKLGVANAIVNFVGDSTTAGRGALASTSSTYVLANSYTGAAPYTVPQQFARLLRAKGINAGSNGYYGDQNINATTAYVNYDTRWTAAGSWGVAGTSSSLGQRMYRWPSGGTVGDLTFTPGVYCDSIRLISPSFSTLGSCKVYCDGVLLGTHTLNGAPASQTLWATDTWTFTRGNSHVFTITPDNNGTTYCARLEVWDSTVPSVIVRGFGWSGGRANDIVPADATMWGGNNNTAYSSIAPDLWVFGLGINDINYHNDQQTTPTESPAQFYANMQLIITAAKTAGGDVVLCLGPQSNTAVKTNWTNGVADQIRAYYKALAVANNCIFIDLSQKLTYNTGLAAGLFWADDIHPTIRGYEIIASTIERVLTA